MKMRLIFCFLGITIYPIWAGGIPEVKSTAQELVANVHGTFSPFKGGTSSKLPDGPVAGNGDIGLVMAGSPDQLDFHIGKADFWGVQRGSIIGAGWLELKTPDLRNATSEVEQNIGPATLSGKFAQNNAELSFTSWVSATKNMVVVELKNSGTDPLNLSSQLFDALGTTGNEATYGSGPESTWLKVSPDTMNLSIGNRLGMGPRGGFNGKIAGFKIFDQALPPAILAQLESEGAPKPLFHWPISGPECEHGPFSDFQGGNNAGQTVGALLIPQRQFTVSAWVNATSDEDLNFIISTMMSAYGKGQYLPSQQRYQSGFALNLEKGCLSATLNYTSTTAANPLPLNQWVQIAAVYDGNSLTLFQDGRSVATTSSFPPAIDVMGWDKKAIHTGGKDLPYAGCAPEGVMLQKILGTNTQEEQQKLTFTLNPGEQATIILPVLTDRNTPNFMAMAQQIAQQTTLDSLAQLFQDHTNWWADFWGKSFIKIPDQKIQDNWYASLYLLACCSKASSPAPGLWGNFVTTEHPEWQGDYTLDYNYEAPFWAALPTNHLELTDNYEQMMLDQMPRGNAIAAHNNWQGLSWYCHLIPAPGWSDDYGTFWGQKSGPLFAVVNCVQRWRYTHDLIYARKIYPLLKGVADFWDNYLVLKDGRYVDIDDSAGENTGHDTNPATTIAFLRLVYPSLIEISQLLHIDDDRRDKWNDILAKLSPLPIAPANAIGAGLEKIDPSVLQGDKLFIRNTETGNNFPDPQLDKYPAYRAHFGDGAHSSAGMSSCLAIFPAWSIGLESEDRERQAGYNTVLADAQWFDFNDDCCYYPSAAAIGIDPHLILKNMHALLDSESPNFMIHPGGGGTENFAVVPATISLMFVQSYQQNIHIFPNWPMEQDAAFGQLNACGGFLVSSEVRNGRILYVEITSKAGQECNMVNPWPTATILVSSTKHLPITLSGSVLKLTPQTNETVLLVPKSY